jgi:hypothetical protein
MVWLQMLCVCSFFIPYAKATELSQPANASLWPLTRGGDRRHTSQERVRSILIEDRAAKQSSEKTLPA